MGVLFDGNGNVVQLAKNVVFLTYIPAVDPLEYFRLRNNLVE